jgi:hypothetical protein
VHRKQNVFHKLIFDRIVSFLTVSSCGKEYDIIFSSMRFPQRSRERQREGEREKKREGTHPRIQLG